MAQERVFDMPHYRALNTAKIAVLREAVEQWKKQFELKTAWDVGCGVGLYSALLLELGFETRALDGRAHNVEEASRRVPGLNVSVADVEDPAVGDLGSADLVFCLGLLYHLENPFRAIGNLAQITGKMIVIESMCTWDELPILYLREESPFEDQGLRHIAFYPSESCLVKMLYRSGFAHVYRFLHLPDSADFRAAKDQGKQRTMLVASRMEASSQLLAPVREQPAQYDPWKIAGVDGGQGGRGAGQGLRKPWVKRLLGIDSATK